MDKTTHQIRSEQWTQIINDWAQSGMNKTAWCKANGISDKSFFYWQRILRNESYIEATGSAVPAVIPESTEKISFVEIKAEDLPSQKKSDFIPDVIIRSGNITLEISNSVSPALLKMLGGLLHAE